LNTFILKVLLLYGQQLAMNHLIATKTLNIIKLDKLLDFPSTNSLSSINEALLIHVFHDETLFSKFVFKSGGYDNITLSNISYSMSKRINYYALKMAMMSKDL
jgi:hypothetical protein